MLHRRSTITALLVALPLAGALTSCGFDYPTDRINQIAAGANDREGTVDVLGARIVAAADGHGRLIGTLANNNAEDASLDAVSSEEVDLTAEVEGVEIAPGGRVNLSQDVEVPVSGEFAAGEVVALVYEFSTGETVELNVPVVKHCFQYADIELPEADAEADAAAGEATEEAEEAAPEDEHATEGGARYLCEHETPEPGEGGH